jgi:hypothetical protein
MYVHVYMFWGKDFLVSENYNVRLFAFPSFLKRDIASSSNITDTYHYESSYEKCV